MKAPKIVAFIVRLTALDGTDNWPSFNKLITVSIVTSYLIGKPIPPEVAIIVITTSHGATAWLRYLRVKQGDSNATDEKL